MSDKLPVLIVGAGPTGLMMAGELARNGVSCRIIDKKSEPTTASNATWLHARTLELLSLSGIADQFVDAGYPCNILNLYIDGRDLVSIPMKYIDSAFKYILTLPQKETERLLESYLTGLKIKVERELELVDVTQQDNQVTAIVENKHGKKTSITCDWLIACDGANSKVRQKLKIAFPGVDLREQFIVADAQTETFLAKDEIHIFFDEGTVFVVSPLGSSNYRIMANLHLDVPRKLYTAHEVIEMAQERAHGHFYVSAVSWISPFWIHGRVSRNMRQGNIFLAGDTVHIHSPAGGQGMNTGIQDAYNLAWKLALVIHGKAKPQLLDSYEAERFPVVSDIVAQNDYYTKLALEEKGFLSKLKKFSKKLSHDKTELAKKIGDKISLLDVAYKNSPIIDYSEHLSPGAPKPGERAPEVIIDTARVLSTYFYNTMHTILLFTGPAPSSAKLKKLKELQQWLGHYSDLIKTFLVTTEKAEDASSVIVDTEGKIHARYDVKAPAVYIIRPDNYIAYVSRNVDSVGVERFLQGYLK